MDNNRIESEDFSDLSDILKSLPIDSKLYNQHVLNIPRYVKFTLNKKCLNQSYLSETLDKSDAEISKWLSGRQNITLRTISRLESALGIKIINPEIKLLIDSLKGAKTTKSPIYTFQHQDSCSYNVFIMSSKNTLVKNSSVVDHIITEGEGASYFEVTEEFSY